MTKSIAVISAIAASLVAPSAAMAVDIEPAEAVNVSVSQPAALGLHIDSAVPKTTKLVSPLKAGRYRMTSSQGARCIPVVGGSTFHEGQDMGATNGDPIYAVADGTVKRTHNGTDNASGYIVVETNIGGRRYDMVYVHMWNANTHVKVGQKIKAGQQISRVGNSGPSTAPHLHFEVWDGAWYVTKSLDPIKFLQKHGLDLTKGATYINHWTAPASCNYRINQFTNLKASASASAKTIKAIASNSIVTSKPGTLINGMVPINTNGMSGWVNRYSISPYSGPAPKPIAPAPQKSTVISSKTVAKGEYNATENVNLRAQAPSGSILVTVPKNASVTATGKTGSGGGWYQVSYGKTSGWISGTYLKKVGTVAPVTSTKPKPVTNKPAPAAGTDKSLVNKKMVTIGGLNLRESAIEGKVVASMPANATVVLTGKTAASGSWVQGKYSGKTGWASKKYLKNAPTKAPAKAPAKTTPSKTTVKTTTMFTTANLNMRAEAVTGKIIKTIPLAGKVTLTGKSVQSGRWVEAKFDGKTGWVSKAYLETKKAEAKKPVVTKKVQVAKTKTTKTMLNMRSAGNPSSSIVTTIKQGAKVNILGSTSKTGWVKVKSGSKTGYVNGGYLK